MAVLNFFGCIDHKHTSHDVRGLNVVVRLRKSCPIMWPRLLWTANKCNWVIQNTEKHNDEELLGDNPFNDHFGKKFMQTQKTLLL